MATIFGVFASLGESNTVCAWVFLTHLGFMVSLSQYLFIGWAFLPVVGQNKPKEWKARAGNRKRTGTDGKPTGTRQIG